MTPPAAASRISTIFPHGRPQGRAHRARRVDVAADVEELGAVVVLAAEGGEPLGAAPQDGGAHRHRLHVGHRRRAAVQAHVGGERRLQPRLALP